MRDDEVVDEIVAVREARREKEKEKEREKKKKQRKVIFAVLLVILWAAIAGGGYYYALLQLEQTAEGFEAQLNAFAQENQRLGAEINESVEGFIAEMQDLHNEMALIKDELELASESISGTDVTRQSLQERIADLDKQLASLKESLRKIEEAVRAL